MNHLSGKPADATASDHVPLLGVLELVATMRPDLLPRPLGGLFGSRFTDGLLQLAADMSAELLDLRAATKKATRDLDRLERWRRPWRRPEQGTDSPNLSALLRFAAQRSAYLDRPTTRARKLINIRDWLGRLHEERLAREHTLAFINPRVTKPCLVAGPSPT